MAICGVGSIAILIEHAPLLYEYWIFAKPEQNWVAYSFWGYNSPFEEEDMV